MGNKGRRIILLSLIAAIFLFSFAWVFGQERKLEIDYPKIFGFKPTTTETSLPEYVKYLFNFSIAIVGLILFGILIWAGFLYLTSAGQPAKLQEARQGITSVFLGAVFLLSSYIILTTINPELPALKLPFLRKIEAPKPKLPEFRTSTTTQIFWEIPIGQMVEKGLWEENRTNNLEALLITLENFLKAESISNLNKKLKTLTESCHCANTTGICQKPTNFAQPAGCRGDPCQPAVRAEINEALNKNREKSIRLLAFKQKISDITRIFENEGRKFRNLISIWDSCKQKGLLTQAEYYEVVDFTERHGGTTKLQRLYQPAGDDPLVFYCPAGGTIFDVPYNPKPIPYEKMEEVANKFSDFPLKEVESLYCSDVIPIGELVIGKASSISFDANRGLEELIFYIDEMLTELSKMTEFVSQCNKSRCQINCSCIPNPCYLRCFTPIGLNPCYFFCQSPCLQSVGGCYGEPCPRQKIIETTERIKFYEDEIFNLLDQIKIDIKDARQLLKIQENDEVDLGAIRAAVQMCLSKIHETTNIEKIEEGSFATLLPCEFAIGSEGPDGNIITDCYPLDFFCCSNNPQLLSSFHFPSATYKKRPTITTPPPEETYSTSLYGFNNVPFFSQKDKRWSAKSFGDCIPAATIGSAGCAPTSLAMALSFFGAKTDPLKMARWIVDKGYRKCGEGTYWSACCAAAKALGGENIVCKDYSSNPNRTSKAKLVLEALRNDKNKIAVVSGRGIPPYSESGHFFVLTGIETVSSTKMEMVHYNDPAYNPGLKTNQQKRVARGQKPVKFFLSQGFGAACVLSKK